MAAHPGRSPSLNRAVDSVHIVDKHHFADGDMSDLAAPLEVLLVHGAGL
jgi:hypothetical protein